MDGGDDPMTTRSANASWGAMARSSTEVDRTPDGLAGAGKSATVATTARTEPTSKLLLTHAGGAHHALGCPTKGGALFMIRSASASQLGRSTLS